MSELRAAGIDGVLSVHVEAPVSFAPLAARWRALERAAEHSFFLSWDWIGCQIEQRFDDPVLIEVRRDGACVALALFNRRRRVWPDRDRLVLHATGRPACDTIFIEHNGVLVARGEAEAARACLAATLRHGVVSLDGIDATQLRAAQATGAGCIARQDRVAPYVDLAAVAARARGYVAGLSANTRQQLRRSARSYEVFGNLRITRAGPGRQSHAFLDELAALHQKAWIGRGQPGAFANPHFTSFHHALIDRSSSVDLLRITAGERVIGYLYNFCLYRRAYAYQSGFDYESAPPHAKPGMTCHQLAIERYLAEDMTMYDFLAGDDRYKSSLATSSRTLHWAAFAPRWSWPGMAGRLKQRARRIADRIRGRRAHHVGALSALSLALMAMPAWAVSLPKPRLAGQLVGVVLQNPATTIAPARMVTFGQEFAQGQVPAGAGVVATLNGQTLPTQLDVTAAYADGSVRIGVMTVAAPAIGAQSAIPLMLTLAPPPVQPALALYAMAGTYDLTINLAMHSGASGTFQMSGRTLIARALHSPATTFWLNGPLLTELRIDTPVVGSLHVVLDIRGYADGTSSTDVQFRNDLAMQPAGGTLVYDATIGLGGVTVMQQNAIRHFQYQSWHTVVSNSPPIGLNVQHDIAALEQTGMVAGYDLSNPPSAAVLANQAALLASPGWGAPLSPNGVTQYMPMTGGRDDIGPTTAANATWLKTQSAQSATVALGQADTAGAVPWQFWNAAAGTWLNTEAYPSMWTDGRSGPGSYTQYLTQPVSTATGWTPDSAHEPDLAYIAYLLTGTRRYLDLLNAQADFSIVSQWPDPSARNGAEGNVIRGNQLRGGAWSLREIDEAAWSNPAGSQEQEYFTRIATNNWHWLVTQIPIWTQQEGKTTGYIGGFDYIDNGFKPWEQDYFISTAVQAAQQGFLDPLTYLTWSANFIAGRFLNQAAGFNPHNGCTYVVGNRVNGVVVTTWSQLQKATVAAGEDNGAGWANSDGDYCTLALGSLAGLLTVTTVANALPAYQYLLSSGAPYTDLVSMQSQVQFDIVPQ